LAKALVAQYHSEVAADQAALRFEETFSARVFPDDAPVVRPDKSLMEADDQIWIIRLLTCSGGGTISSSEASRLVRQGAVEVDGEVIQDRDARIKLDRERRVQVGKRRFFRVLVPK
jgi:tyrosyl-tRNA synthetase